MKPTLYQCLRPGAPWQSWTYPNIRHLKDDYDHELMMLRQEGWTVTEVTATFALATRDGKEPRLLAMRER